MKRRILSVVVLLALLVALLTPVAVADTTGWVTTEEKGDYVRLRSGPGPYSVLVSVRDGTKLSILSKSGNWYKVYVAAKKATGYIYKSYVRLSGDDPSPKPEETSTLGYTGKLCTVSSSTPLRASASTSAAKRLSLAKGAKLVITGTKGKFYAVRVISSGRTGYVLKTAVKMGAKANIRGRVYLRKGTSVNTSIIKTLASGAGVTVYEVYSKWSRVVAGGKKGYVSNSYLKF